MLAAARRRLAARPPAALAADFSSKRRARYGSETDRRESSRLLSFARGKQQTELRKFREALAQEALAQEALAQMPLAADSSADGSIKQPEELNRTENGVDAKKKQVDDATRAQRAKQAKQERIKHLPLFKADSALQRHFGLLTLGHFEQLPPMRFQGDVTVIHSALEEVPHAEYLRAQQVVGVDTESKPDFRKHKRGNPVCLIQVATLDRAFLYRLRRGQPLPPVLRALLEDASVLKAGHSLSDDFRLLKASQLVTAVNTTVDTLPIANKLGCVRPGLKTLGQLFLGGTMSKAMQVSNWEAQVLSDAQINYAATDAWAPLRVLLAMIRLPETRALLRIKTYNSTAQPILNDDHDKVFDMLHQLALSHQRSDPSGTPQ